MKNTIFPLLFGAVLFPVLLIAQPSLTLEECYTRARANYPLLDQQAINEQLTQIELENLDLQKRFQLAWNAQATYQTESVEAPFPNANGEFFKLPLLNGQTTLEATYNLYDGGRIEAVKNMEIAGLRTSQQAVEVELAKLKERVNQLYFGILISQAQDSILLQTRKDLRVRLDQLNAGERQGIVLPSEVTKLRVELLRLESRRSSLSAQRNRLLATLGDLTGQPLDSAVDLTIPELPSVNIETPVERPELELFRQQQAQVLSRVGQIEAQRRPQLSVFARAGLGYPNPLNFFDDTFSPFGVAGIQFRWNLLDWGKKDNDRQKLQLQTQLIEAQKATFLYNLEVLDGQYIADEQKLQDLIDQNEAIRALQEELLQQTASQLEHGVATANDYLIQSNAITQTRLNLKLYQLQLKQLKVEYLTNKGLL